MAHRAPNDTKVVYLLTNHRSTVFLRGQLAYLQDHGYDILVVTNFTGAAGPLLDDGVASAHVPFVRDPSPVMDLRCLVQTVRIVRRTRPGIVNASTPKAALLGLVAAWICRVPVRVHVVRGFRFEGATGWRRRFFRTMEWIAMACADHVLFNSRSLMRVAEQERLPLGRGAGVLGAGSGNGVDPVRLAPTIDEVSAKEALGLEPSDPVIGFVGRLVRDKGIEDLVRVFGVVAEAVAGCRLLLVGELPEDSGLSPSCVRSIEEDASIIVLPHTGQLGDLYRAMDVLAFPSFREGLPNVPLEAQWCGVPVVGYAATGTVDAVNDGVSGVLVGLGDRSGLARELIGLLRSPERRHCMGRAGSDWVGAEFAQDRVWSALLERYQSWSRPEPA